MRNFKLLCGHVVIFCLLMLHTTTDALTKLKLADASPNRQGVNCVLAPAGTDSGDQLATGSSSASHSTSGSSDTATDKINVRTSGSVVAQSAQSETAAGKTAAQVFGGQVSGGDDSSSQNEESSSQSIKAEASTAATRQSSSSKLLSQKTVKLTQTQSIRTTIPTTATTASSRKDSVKVQSIAALDEKTKATTQKQLISIVTSKTAKKPIEEEETSSVQLLGSEASNPETLTLSTKHTARATKLSGAGSSLKITSGFAGGNSQGFGSSPSSNSVTSKKEATINKILSRSDHVIPGAVQMVESGNGWDNNFGVKFNAANWVERSVKNVQANVWVDLDNLRGQSVLSAGEIQEILSKSIPGKDYPTYGSIPITKFNCENVNQAGFYADPETRCQVIRRCDINAIRWNYLCPNSTVFNQITLTCDWYFNVDCSRTVDFYDYSNSRLYHADWVLLDTPKE